MTESSPNNKEKIKVSDYFIFFAPFLIFLGMTHLITFYNGFGISIVRYLDLTEIIVSFFDVILAVAFVYAYAIIQNFFSGNFLFENEIQKRENIINENSLVKLMPLYLSYLRLPLILGLIIIVASLTAFLPNYKISYWAPLSISLLVIFGICLKILDLEIERRHLKNYSNIERKRFIFLTLYLLVSIFAISYYSKYKVYDLKSNKSSFGVTIYFNDDVKFVSDSSNYYISNTRNFLFIFHQQQNKTDVIPMSRIKQITMLKNQ
jgi:hypothetical protein